MIPVASAHLMAFAISHPGMKGKNNEDRCLVSAFRVSETNPTPVLLALVADGVGGHRAGEVAAEIAAEVISRAVASSDASRPLATLQEAFERANQAIYAHSLADPERAGMGTTCACAWVIGDRLFIASVGDSRIYLFRAGQVFQLTTDHTWIQEALETGTLTPQEARNHPNAHMIRRHLGSHQPVDTDFRLKLRAADTDQQALANQGALLHAGDQLVICSDGLTDLVTAAEIQTALASGDLHPALQGLVDLANRRGGHDNISIVGITVPQRKAAALAVPARARPWSLLVTGLLLLALLILASYGLYRWWTGEPAAATPTARFTEAPLALPSLVPTGTPFQPSPTLPSSAIPGIPPGTPVAPGASAQPATETPGGPQPTYTPWPTSTGAAP